MQQLVPAFQNSQEFEDVDELPERAEWVLKKLKPVHIQICSLLAQGFKNIEVAKLTNVTPEYITMLLRQPLIKDEIYRRGEFIGQRFELMTEKSCDVISEAMSNGNNTEKLKAARLQLEVTRRIGRPDPMAVVVNVGDDRLAKLAERLEGLLDEKRTNIYDQHGNPI